MFTIGNLKQYDGHITFKSTLNLGRYTVCCYLWQWVSDKNAL